MEILLSLLFLRMMLCPGSAENIGKLLNRNHFFFVPFRQDNPITKPRSLVFDANYIVPTLEAALDGEQIQPMIL